MILSREEVIEKLKTAFLPFECRAELQDYDSKFGFAVLDENGNILFRKDKIPFKINKMNLKEFPSDKLYQIIESAKQRLENVRKKNSK